MPGIVLVNDYQPFQCNLGHQYRDGLFKENKRKYARKPEKRGGTAGWHLKIELVVMIVSVG